MHLNCHGELTALLLAVPAISFAWLWIKSRWKRLRTRPRGVCKG